MEVLNALEGSWLKLVLGTMQVYSSLLGPLAAAKGRVRNVMVCM